MLLSEQLFCNGQTFKWESDHMFKGAMKDKQVTG